MSQISDTQTKEDDQDKGATEDIQETTASSQTTSEEEKQLEESRNARDQDAEKDSSEKVCQVCAKWADFLPSQKWVIPKQI